MTKERLEQLKYIELALKNIRDDIAKLNLSISQSTGKVFTDVTKGSMTEHPYIERHYTVEGVNMSSCDRLRAKLRVREDELQERLLELETWLEGIKNEKLYLIFRLKYRKGMTWGQIGAEIGYHRTRVSRLHDEYLKLSEQDSHNSHSSRVNMVSGKKE